MAFILLLVGLFMTWVGGKIAFPELSKFVLESKDGYYESPSMIAVWMGAALVFIGCLLASAFFWA